MTRTWGWNFAFFSAAVLLFTWVGVSAPEQQRPPRADYNSGAYLFKVFCASCHGDTGKGDGPVADLAGRPPADLTMLARRHGGLFPRDHVMAILEGATPLPGHAPPVMPNWRNVLRKTEGDDERVIRQRLDALVAHVETLQQK